MEGTEKRTIGSKWERVKKDFPIVRKKSQELEEEVLQADLLQLWQSLLHHSLK